MGHAMRRAASGLVGFSPLQVGWAHAYWAEGPEFVALGLSNGAAVSTWPDEIGTADLTQATSTKQPAYQATAGAGSQPAVKADGGDVLHSATITTITQPFTLVCVLTGEDNDSVPIAADDGSLRFLYGVGTRWAIYFGNYLQSATTADFGAAHLMVAFASGSNSQIEKDGTALVTGNAGTGTATSVTLFGGGNTPVNPSVAALSFGAIYSGDARTDPKWAQFKAWVTSHYGITVV